MGGTFSRFFNLFQARYVAKTAGADRPAALSPSIATSPVTTASDPSQTAPDGKQYDGDYRELPAYVERLSLDWVAGRHVDDQARAANDEALGRRIIEQLDALVDSEFSGANLVPRVPSVMVQLLKRSHEENVTDSDLARLIAKDVVLVAALLTEVNSSFYKTNKQVTDLNQAIMLLGHNRLRLVLARLSFTPVFNDQFGSYARSMATRLWELSQQRSLACYVLAKAAKVDPFLAFLAGLMQEVGFVVALRIMERIDSQAELPASAAFDDALRHRIATLSARIAQYWAMPEPVVAAMAGQADQPMTPLLQQANYISRLCLLMHDEVLDVDMKKMPATLDPRGLACLDAIRSGRVTLANVM